MAYVPYVVVCAYISEFLLKSNCVFGALSSFKMFIKMGHREDTCLEQHIWIYGSVIYVCFAGRNKIIILSNTLSLFTLR